jgi:hypothetical protein
MNPLRWKREHKIALLAAAVLGACIGIFAGVRQTGSQPDQVALWAIAGAAMGVVGVFLRVLLRN